MIFDEFKKYLPFYLSSESQKELMDLVRQFTKNGRIPDSSFYTIKLTAEKSLFQGDIIRNMPIIDLRKEDDGQFYTKSKQGTAMLLSNTCDMDPANIRKYPLMINYAPVIELDKYSQFLRGLGFESKKIDSHFQTIKTESISNLLYIPQFKDLKESIVFLDRIYNASPALIYDTALENKVTTLSDFGFYLLIAKLSIHFSRMQEKVQRNKGIVL